MENILELMAELGTASSLLEFALGRYISACTAVQTYYAHTAFADVPHTLSNRIARELATVSSYNVKMKHAISLIGQARNCSITLTPIHSLPSEILARIFQLIVGASCDVDVNSLTPTSLPKYPDFLSHVCSRWRSIVINLPVLWSHIDLVEWHPLGPKFVDRASTCVLRARDIPLSVHIRVPAAHDTYTDAGGDDFVRSIASQTRSIELAIPHTRLHFESVIYDFLFETFKPETLLQLEIIDRSSYTPDFILASNSYDPEVDEDDPPGYLLSVTEENFEGLLSSVQILRLEGIYPLWSSLAYHGLVELYLHRTGTGTGVKIQESQLYDILIASPKLTTLHFGLHIITGTQGRLDVPPVQLENLKQLNLAELSGPNDLPNFLGLLAPTSNALRLSLLLHPNVSLSPNSKGAIITFLRQSHVTKLHLKGFRQKIDVQNLLGLFPQLRILVLNNFHDDEPPKSPANFEEKATQSKTHRLDTVYVRQCSLDLNHFHQLDRMSAIQAIVLRKSYVCRNRRGMQEDQVIEELSKICGIVKYFGSREAIPAKDWDFGG